MHLVIIFWVIKEKNQASQDQGGMNKNRQNLHYNFQWDKKLDQLLWFKIKLLDQV